MYLALNMAGILIKVMNRFKVFNRMTNCTPVKLICGHHLDNIYNAKYDIFKKNYNEKKNLTQPSTYI